jgi:hypothetical protein
MEGWLKVQVSSFKVRIRLKVEDITLDALREPEMRGLQVLSLETYSKLEI